MSRSLGEPGDRAARGGRSYHNLLMIDYQL
jgi:hypothetical protein